MFSKNKTFNYQKESSTTRGEHFAGVGLDQRRQRSSKAPTMALMEAQKQVPQGIEGQTIGKQNGGGHFTPQLAMSSQSES